MTPIAPIDAATVILTREAPGGAGGWQCFMVRRHVQSDFASDVYVFPGGKVDVSDSDPRVAVALHLDQVDPTRQPSHWTSIQLAAIRELFEEAGVLLAETNGELLQFGERNAGRFAGFREALRRGEMTMLELARAENLVFRTDLLRLFSRWITPVNFPKRFDTWFFVAQAPPNQEPLHDTFETVDSVWITPAEALERSSAGLFPLVFATEKHLEALTSFDSAASLFAECDSVDLEPIIPHLVSAGGYDRFLLPGDEGY